jgi:hypothetical protein
MNPLRFDTGMTFAAPIQGSNLVAPIGSGLAS